MKKYVSRVECMRNGSRIRDFKNFKKDAVEYLKSISLMGGTGAVEVTKKHTFSIDYVIPKENPKLDWSDVINEDSWSFPLNGGTRIEYVGVDCLSEGDFTVDGENETVMTLAFQAEDRTIR